MRENAKLLFTAVIDNDSIKQLLNNHSVDEVIVHVLKLASWGAIYLYLPSIWNFFSFETKLVTFLCTTIPI